MRRTWTVPAMIAALTVIGLISGLLADGLGDTLALIGLLVPTVISVRILMLKKR